MKRVVCSESQPVKREYVLKDELYDVLRKYGWILDDEDEDPLADDYTSQMLKDVLNELHVYRM